jgi:hypothetical protein
LGILFSYILKCTRYYKNDAMYLDEAKTLVNSDLFLPPIAKVLRKRNQQIQDVNVAKRNADENNKF